MSEHSKRKNVSHGIQNNFLSTYYGASRFRLAKSEAVKVEVKIDGKYRILFEFSKVRFTKKFWKNLEDSLNQIVTMPWD